MFNEISPGGSFAWFQPVVSMAFPALIGRHRAPAIGKRRGQAPYLGRDAPEFQRFDVTASNSYGMPAVTSQLSAVSTPASPSQ